MGRTLAGLLSAHWVVIVVLMSVSTLGLSVGVLPSLFNEELLQSLGNEPSQIDPRVVQQILHDAQNDEPDSVYLFAILTFHGRGVNQDVAKAVQLLKRLAQRGHPDAEFALGVLYATGSEGVAQNDRMSVVWLTSSANRGHADAKWMLATMYNEGRGVPEDSSTALQLLEDAASQQNARALFHLGVMFEYGRGGVAQNFTAAASLYAKASDLGIPDAMYYLGLLLTSERIPEQNFGRGFALFQRAADLQYAPAMFRLGEMHINGHGVSIDYSIALFWLKRAAGQNDPSISPRAKALVRELEWVLTQAEAYVTMKERELGVPLRVQVATVDGS